MSPWKNIEFKNPSTSTNAGNPSALVPHKGTLVDKSPNKNILFPLSKGKAANTISPNTTYITLLVNLKAFISFSVSL